MPMITSRYKLISPSMSDTQYLNNDSPLTMESVVPARRTDALGSFRCALRFSLVLSQLLERPEYRGSVGDNRCGIRIDLEAYLLFALQQKLQPLLVAAGFRRKENALYGDDQTDTWWYDFYFAPIEGKDIQFKLHGYEMNFESTSHAADGGTLSVKKAQDLVWGKAPSEAINRWKVPHVEEQYLNVKLDSLSNELAFEWVNHGEEKLYSATLDIALTIDFAFHKHVKLNAIPWVPKEVQVFSTHTVLPGKGIVYDHLVDAIVFTQSSELTDQKAFTPVRPL